MAPRILALVIVSLFTVAEAINVSTLIAASNDGLGSFQLARVEFGLPSPVTPLGSPLAGWVLLQGDATAYDGVNTFFAVLTAAVGGVLDRSNSSLFAFDVRDGSVVWSYSGFPSNYTFGALAWEPSFGLVGLCGSLLIDSKVEGFCGLNVVAGERTPRLIKDWQWTLAYDPDTRALDPTTHRYYHRLYNRTWLPDYFVTLDSRTGELLTTVQFWSPEFSGTRLDTATGGLWSICNAPAGLDVCGVDPTTGAFTPTGALDRVREDSFIYAATAALDAAHGLYVVVVELAVDGTFARAVDINATSPTFGAIVANYSVPANPWLSNMHALGAPDDVPSKAS